MRVIRLLSRAQVLIVDFCCLSPVEGTVLASLAPALVPPPSRWHGVALSTASLRRLHICWQTCVTTCSYVPPALAPHFGWFKHVAKRPIPARRISRRLLRDMWSIGRHGHISAHTITHDDPHSSSNSKTPSALALCSDDVFKSLCRM